jgi:catecholate siderophore receptor
MRIPLAASRNPSRHVAIVGFALLLSARAGAQVAPPARPAPPDSAPAKPTLARVLIVDSSARRTRYLTASTASATRTQRLLRDVPQSATVITRALIADQAMQSMADVVRYVPGVTMALGEGHRDAPTIRGTSSTADFFIDGVRDDAQYYRDVYNVERVEALKGANAMVFGRGGGGGVLNRVTKNAFWQNTRAVSLTGGSFDQRRATLDVGDGFGAHVALRLNGLYDNSRTFRQESGSERTGVNPTAAVMLGNATLRLGYEYYDDRRVVDRGIPSFNGAPSVAPIRSFFGDPAASRARVTAHAATATLDQQLRAGNDVSDGLHLRNRTMLMTYDKFYQNIFPGAVSPDMQSVSLSGYNNATDRQNLFNQTDLSTTLTRGALRQTLLLGAELGRQQTDNVRTTAFFGDAASTTTSVAVPFARPRSTIPARFRPGAADANALTTLSTRALYVQNQIAVGAHLQAILGLRVDRLSIEYENRRNAQQFARTDNLVSPRAGLVVKPTDAVSVYSSYSVSFLPGSGDQFGSLSATTQTLEPEQFTNREVGVKWDATPTLSLTAALYRLDRTNTSSSDPQTPGLILQTGATRTSGLEVGANGSLTSRWQIAGGFAHQSARIQSTTLVAAAGATVPLVPRRTVSLWNRYQFASRVGAGVGIVHQDKMFAAIDNAVTLPPFTRIDGAVFLTLSRTLRAQLNVENVLNRRYYPTAHSNNNIMPGSPRMVRAALHVTP